MAPSSPRPKTQNQTQPFNTHPGLLPSLFLMPLSLPRSQVCLTFRYNIQLRGKPFLPHLAWKTLSLKILP